MSPHFQAKMPRRVWEPIAGFPTYFVNRRGEIRNSRKQVMRTFMLHNGPSLTLSVKDEKTTVRVARIVGAAFCEDYADDLYPVFRNGKHHDCRACNLRWVTRSEIMKGTRKK